MVPPDSSVSAEPAKAKCKNRILGPLIWLFFVFGISSIPGSNTPDLPLFPLADKLVHAAIYAVGGFLLARATGSPWLGAAIAIGVGPVDEFYQSFIPGRMPDYWDALADAIGAMLGSLIYAITQGRRSTGT